MLRRIALLPLLFLAVPAGGRLPAECPVDEEALPAAPRVEARPRPVPLLLQPDAPDCSGALVLLDEEGEPFEGAAVVVNHGHYFRADLEGRVEWEGRPCGRQELVVRVDDTLYELGEVEVRGREDLVLTWPAEDFAILRLTGPDCRPWPDLPARPARVSAIDALGDGRFRVWSVDARVVVAVRLGGAEQELELPIDGGEHAFTLLPPRQVEVEARCPAHGCTGLFCSGEPCVALGPDRFRCPCPPTGASLRGKGSSPHRPVPDGATRVLIEQDERIDHGGELLAEPWPVLEWGPAPIGCQADTG